MTTPEESHEGLISAGASGLVRRMDHRLELVGRLMEEIQAKGSSRTVAPPEAVEAYESFEGNRPGEERRFEIAPGVKMTFCWCPPGDFVMGSTVTEEHSWAYQDQVKVTLTKGFWMLKTEVTQAQWQAVMGSNPSHFQGANLPVETVSWNDAQDFLQELNARLGSADGGIMVLPTEAQWEYAARAKETATCSGDPLDQVAWYAGNSSWKTQQAGTKKSNAWGLHDMIGNVGEWCADWYFDTLRGGVDPKGPASGSRRATRGGSWSHGASNCCVTFRYPNDPTFSNNSFGFRVARISGK